MSPTVKSRRGGFALIEALIALLLIAVGLVAVSKLQTISLFGSGDARQRTEAANFSQQKLEELRNVLRLSDFTALTSGSVTKTGAAASYNVAWTVTTPNAGLDQRLVQITTTWENAQGVTQRLDLNTLIAWDDPIMPVLLASGSNTKSLISPTGEAERGTGQVPVGTPYVSNPDGTRTYTDDTTKKTYLADAEGNIILLLPPKKDNNGNPVAQAFTTITGRVYFDQNAGNNALPPSASVRVRLSSEGECKHDNAANSLLTAAGGSNSYKYFTYTCYVGPGWYGNVGVTVDDSVTGNAASPTVCVGDPGFNGGVSDSSLISAHSREAAVRSYRGFRGSPGSYLSTGMAGGSKYGLSYRVVNGAVVLDTNSGAPFDGMPKPSGYPAFYPSVSAGSVNDYFNQDFLLTRFNNNSSCATKMAGGVFTRNAGKYVCINPDVLSAETDRCPTVWPGFEGEVGVGGSINYTLTVVPSGTGTGLVTALTGGINCGLVCSGSYAAGTSVTLTATASTGSTFAGWVGGGCSGTDPCVVTMSAGVTVTATFNGSGSPTDVPLTVTKTGSGAGIVTSAPAAIDCGIGCSALFTANSTVTLSAAPAGGSNFGGWTGDCTGTGTCMVTMSAARNVTASFTTTNATHRLTVSKAGTGSASGRVTSSPAGIDCGSGNGCWQDYPVNTVVTLTAVAPGGTTFAGWSGGGCSGTGNCTVTMGAATTVTATFTTNPTCTTPISGQVHLNANNNNAADGDVTASPSTYGGCSVVSGTAVYNCSFNAPSGTGIVLTNARTTGAQNLRYSFSLSITANCALQGNVNFP